MPTKPDGEQNNVNATREWVATRGCQVFPHSSPGSQIYGAYISPHGSKSPNVLKAHTDVHTCEEVILPQSSINFQISDHIELPSIWTLSIAQYFKI